MNSSLTGIMTVRGVFCFGRKECTALCITYWLIEIAGEGIDD